MTKHLKISVRGLVEHGLRSGDLSLESWSSVSPIDGLRAHQKLQRSRGDGYASEVPITGRWERDNFVLDVEGRIDGVFTDHRPPVVEEIKTTRNELDAKASQEDPLHWGQVKVYAFFYAADRKLASVQARLTYYHLESGEIREVTRTFATSELAEFFERLASRYLEWAARLEEARAHRDRSIRALDFPFAEYRPGQRRLAVEVYRTLKGESQLLARAPTGIGKTMAVVFPAVKSLAEGVTDKIFYLTARTTGRLVAEEALSELGASGLRCRSVSLTAKDKICFNPDKACNGEECLYARGYYDRIEGALEEIFRTDRFTRDVIERIAGEHRVCPFELSLELCRWAEVVIADYNYVFDPRVQLRRLFPNEREPYAFVVDEAHNLADRGREIFSAEIRKTVLLELRRALPRGAEKELRRTLSALNRVMLERRKKTEAATGVLTESGPPTELYPKLRGFVFAAERALARNRGTPSPYRRDLLELFFEVSRFLKVAEGYDDRYVTCSEARGLELRVKLYCKDPSVQLAESLKRGRSSIFFSATLTPADYFRRILGLGDEARSLVLPSPFPRENLCLLLADRIATRYRQREASAPSVARLLETFVRSRSGNYLLFFPSYAYLRRIEELFVAPDVQTEVVTQEPGMSEAERVFFVNRFQPTNGNRNENGNGNGKGEGQGDGKTLIGFAVMGGVFGEGIDLVGDRLVGAAVVGVGLPGISPERERIRDHFEDELHGGAGFDFAYLYPGMSRVLQAAGRVIRSESDQGAVLLIDERFSEARYRSLLPAEWQPRAVRDSGELSSALARFWGRHP